MNSKQTFGERLRQIRQHLKFKQADFADRLNISGPALSEIENDKYKPGHDFFLRISKEFNVNLYFLLFGQGEMFNEGIKAFSPGLSRFAVTNEEAKKFLWFFEHSPIVQYYILGQFRRFFQKEKKEIEMDIESFKEE